MHCLSTQHTFPTAAFLSLCYLFIQFKNFVGWDIIGLFLFRPYFRICGKQWYLFERETSPFLQQCINIFIYSNSSKILDFCSASPPNNNAKQTTVMGKSLQSKQNGNWLLVQSALKYLSSSSSREIGFPNPYFAGGVFTANSCLAQLSAPAPASQRRAWCNYP